MELNESVKIYGAERCHKSRYYCDYFKQRDISFAFYDVEKNEDFAKELRSLYDNGRLNFPTLVIDGKKMRNPSHQDLEKQLNKRHHA